MIIMDHLRVTTGDKGEDGDPASSFDYLVDLRVAILREYSVLLVS